MALAKNNNDVQNKDSNNTDLKLKYTLPEPGEIKPISIRLPENYTPLLKDYFKKRGIPLGTGLRNVIYEFMNKNNIR